MSRSVVLRSVLVSVPFLTILAIACYTPHGITRDQLKAGDYPKNEQLRVFFEEGNVILYEGWTLDYPFVEGDLDESEGRPLVEMIERSPQEKTNPNTGRPIRRVRLNVDDAQKIEIYAFSRGKTGGLVGGTVGGTVLAVIALILIIGPGPSCPTVYLHTPSVAQIVGGIHPGSAFVGSPSEDYLALKPFRGLGVIDIVNEHREIEYLDAIALASVNHRSGEQVVAMDGRPVIVADGNISDLSIAGADLASISSIDGVAFQGGISRNDRTDRIDIRFTPRETGALVLLVTAENTRWFDALTQTFLARSSGAPPPLKDVAMKLSLDGSEPRLVVPVGSDGFRTFAIPLGPRRKGDACALSIETPRSCWRFDALRVAKLIDSHPRINWHRGVMTTRFDRGEESDLTRADAKAVVMRMGDRFTLRYQDLDCVTASCFLWTVGRYEVIPSVPKPTLDVMSVRSDTTFEELNDLFARAVAR